MSIKTVGGFIARTSLMLVLLVAGWLLQTPSVQAAGPVCTVGASGANYTTIQAAVNDSGCATINVAAGTYAENVTIRRGVTINGAMTGTTIVDGNNAASVFNIHVPHTAVSLNHLVIQNGAGTDPGFGARVGGGMLLYQANLTINNSTIRNNQARIAGAIAVLTAGSQVHVYNSTIHNNEGTDDVGGIYSVSGASIVNSTISNNRGNETSAVYVHGTSSASLTMLNSTLTDNESVISAGLAVLSTGYTSIANTILNNPLSARECASNSISNSRNNLLRASSSSCGLSNGVDGNIIGQDPKLGPLQINAPGTTMTHALLAGSPAIDAGNDAVCNTAPVGGRDQRGNARPQGAHCDIGAVEVNPPLPTATP